IAYVELGQPRGAIPALVVDLAGPRADGVPMDEIPGSVRGVRALAHNALEGLEIDPAMVEDAVQDDVPSVQMRASGERLQRRRRAEARVDLLVVRRIVAVVTA